MTVDERLASEMHFELLPCILGPFRIAAVEQHTLPIEEDKIPNFDLY